MVAAVVGIGAALGGAAISSHGAKAGAKAQTDASNAGIAEQHRQYDLSRSDEMPYMQAGSGALGQMGKLNNGDFSQFFQSPDYKFALDQGLQSVDAGAAARGNVFGPATQLAEMKFGQGLATQNYSNFYNRLAGIVGLGQNAASQTGNLGAESANRISGLYSNIGDARAQGAVGSANSWSNALEGIGKTYGGKTASGFGLGGD